MPDLSADTEEVNTPDNSSDTTTPENSGSDRPEWLPEKFQTPAEMAKSYTELEKRLGMAPKEYDFSKGESWIDPNHQSFQDLANYAKSKNVPQDVMDKVLESMGSYLDEFQIDYDAEKEKLGKDANERLEKLINWTKANFSEDAYNAITDSLRDAEGVKALEEIRQKMLDANVTVPGGNEDSSSESSTLEDLQAEMTENLDKYKSDPKYRRDLDNRIAKIAEKSGTFTDKQY